MSNWFSALIWPIRPVLAMWWFSPLTVTVPSGASKVTPSDAAFTASTQNDSAFSTMSL